MNQIIFPEDVANGEALKWLIIILQFERTIFM